MPKSLNLIREIKSVVDKLELAFNEVANTEKYAKKLEQCFELLKLVETEISSGSTLKKEVF